MRILDEDGNEIEEFDPKLGHLVDDQIVSEHHDAVEAVEEVGHYEVVAEYPNGGKDVDWIVDTPGVEAKEAYDEYEQIKRFIAFTPAELAAIRINELKLKLINTDHIILGIVEGSRTLDDCADIIAQRNEWRTEINNLENGVGE